jgi:hypothetical protein
VVKLKERYSVIISDVAEIKSILVSHISSSNERHRELLATFNQHNLEDAVIHQRVVQIDAHLTNTDTNVANLTASVESDKRSPVALILGTLSGLGTAATAIWMAIKG